jgi:DNA-binding transcriptional ArsR family regulator
MAQKSTEAFADDAPLMKLFGQPARTRLISVFVDEREYDLNVSELAEQAGVARSTVYDHLDTLAELGVVEQTRETGNSKRYQLNQDSQLAELLNKLEGVTLRTLLENRDDVDF